MMFLKHTGITTPIIVFGNFSFRSAFIFLLLRYSRFSLRSHYVFLLALFAQRGRKLHNDELYYVFVCLFLARQPPQWARASSFTRFLDHTQRRTTVGRTPLDE